MDLPYRCHSARGSPLKMKRGAAATAAAFCWEWTDCGKCRDDGRERATQRETGKKNTTLADRVTGQDVLPRGGIRFFLGGRGQVDNENYVILKGSGW